MHLVVTVLGSSRDSILCAGLPPTPLQSEICDEASSTIEEERERPRQAAVGQREAEADAGVRVAGRATDADSRPEPVRGFFTCITHRDSEPGY